MFKSIYYWYYRNKHDIPHPEEMEMLCYDVYIRKYPEGGLFYRSRLILQHYIAGKNLQLTAEKFNVTRERVRQIIWKWWRTAKNIGDNHFNMEK